MQGVKKNRPIFGLVLILTLIITFFPIGHVKADTSITTPVTWTSDQVLSETLHIQPGGELTISSGVIVQVECSDFRFKIIVEPGGFLDADGATFEGDGTAGCWDGIVINSEDDQSIIQNSTIRDAQLGITIIDSSPTIYNNEIHNLKGPDGENPGDSGDNAAGIWIQRYSNLTTEPTITENYIHNVTGGAGMDGTAGADGTQPDNLDGGDGQNGGGGGRAYGIAALEGTFAEIANNRIEYLFAGDCGAGGDGGNGADGVDATESGVSGGDAGDGGLGGNAGDPGDVFGIYTYNPSDTTITGNTISNLYRYDACQGGDGGDGGTGGAGFNGNDADPSSDGGAGGDGGNGGLGSFVYTNQFVGIYVFMGSGNEATHQTISGNIISAMSSGFGGPGGNGGNGGDGGIGGSITVADSTNINGSNGGPAGNGGNGGQGGIGGDVKGIETLRLGILTNGNEIHDLSSGGGGTGGSGGQGGNGGQGGQGSLDVSENTYGISGNGGNGGYGGNAGSGGNAGYSIAVRHYGIPDLTVDLINNDLWSVNTDVGGDAGAAGLGGNGGNGGTNLVSSSDGTGGNGGDAGDGGNGTDGGISGQAILLQLSNETFYVVNNTLADPFAVGYGGAGSSGAAAGTPGTGGSGAVTGTSGSTGASGSGGSDGPGGFVVGINHIDSSNGTEIVNNIFSYDGGLTNSIGIYEDLKGQISLVDYNNIYGWTTDADIDSSLGVNNISSDPLFTGTDDHTLSSGSPSIDTGDNDHAKRPTDDIVGESRPQDGDHDSNAIVDMGAYEAVASNVSIFIPLLLQ